MKYHARFGRLLCGACSLVLTVLLTLMPASAQQGNNNNGAAAAPPPPAVVPAVAPAPAGPAGPAPAVPLQPNTPLNNPFFDIMFGAITLDPFRVVANGTNGFRLQPDNNETYFTIQVNYARRWAWESDSKVKLNNKPESILDDIYDVKGFDLRNLFMTKYDFQSRIGYTFGQNATNASTVVGSGNLDIELSLGKHIWRNADTNSGFANSVNLEAAVEMVTDREFSDAHSTLFFGPAYVASFHYSTGRTNDLVALFFRGGLARYELPRLGEGLNIETDTSGLPKYRNVWGAALETEVHWQLLTGFVTAGARAYPSVRPAPWTFWVGYSVTSQQISSFIGHWN